MEKTFTYSRAPLAALLILFSLSVSAQPAIIKRDLLVTNWSRPTSLITDKWGQVYFISDNWVLSFADSLGSLVTFAAGTGDAAYYGDGGPALSAGLDQPYGLCEDPKGYLYIGTRGDNRIRKVGPGGFISTLAGNGTAGYTGDGGPATLASLAGINGLWGDA